MGYGDYIDFREISLIFSVTQTAILVVILQIRALFLKVKLFRCHEYYRYYEVFVHTEDR